jgi:chromosomal replication initiator protein
VSVSATSPFLAECISRRFGPALRQAAREETGDPSLEVKVCVVESVEPQDDAPSASLQETTPHSPPSSSADSTAHRVPPQSARQRRRNRSEIQPTLTLDSFIVGRCNKLAHSAALALTQGDHAHSFNVVFVHGQCGVGKTHLLQGAVLRFQQENPSARVLYTTGEAFTNAFVTAIRKGDTAAFRKKHRGLDLLCIDDVHFLSNKNATQAEFLHTFNAMDLEGARLMLASDEHPGKIKQFSRELVSRFSAGMVVELDLPDPVTRRRIVISLARDKGLTLTEDAVTAIADHQQGSVRDIAGALNRLNAIHTLLPDQRTSTGPLDVVDVRLALGTPHRPRARRPLKVQLIAQTITEALAVTMPELLSRSRRPRVVAARSMTFYLARTLTTLSFPEIATAMGRPNHSTVITAHKRVERKIAAAELCGDDIDLPVTTWGELADELRRRVLSANIAP